MSDAPHDPVREAFDAEFYLAAYPDVAENGADPWEHFVLFGAREGRDPRPDFSTRAYLAANPDVSEASVNAFEHWIHHGRAEGRALNLGLGYRFEALAAEPFETVARRLAQAPILLPAPPAQVLLDALAAADDRPWRLAFSHDDYTRSLGGVQFVLRREADQAAAADERFLHLYPARSGLSMVLPDEASPLAVTLDARFLGVFAVDTIVRAIEALQANPERTWAIHNLIGHEAGSVLAILEAFRPRDGVFWLHDFGSLCANYALLRTDIEACGAPPLSSPACEVCVYGRRRAYQLAAMTRLLTELDPVVVAPSEAALALWRDRFPSPPKRQRVVAHAELETVGPPPRGRVEPDNPLRVGFLGMPVLHKGWPVFADLVRRFGDDPRYSFHHLGKARGRGCNVAFTPAIPDAANPAPMVAAVEALQLDVALVWSLCPETFCLTAYEAAAGGAAVVTHPAAGNVPVFAATGEGRVLADETALIAAFAQGELHDLARRRRRPARRRLVYSDTSWPTPKAPS
ncbi:hypothetical protein [Brevundimonas sp.]|uniref:hypothetical protein n=1 Tax=Brevundimonas sp. TaxID=1871086 RepID=UPI00391AC9FB